MVAASISASALSRGVTADEEAADGETWGRDNGETLPGADLPTPPDEYLPADDTLNLKFAFRGLGKTRNLRSGGGINGDAWDQGGQQHEDGKLGSADVMDVERELWKAHYEALRAENEHLRHVVYLNALSSAPSPKPRNPDRLETRSLRQQLAYMDDRCQSLTDKMAKLQEQTAEAYRLLAQERLERLEERNNQLTVVVAKHGLERRMRNREQDLQAEWRRNAELSERCQRLKEELVEARGVASHGNLYEIPLRSKEPRPSPQELPTEDDWSDRPSHVPPEFGYSKFARWKKRTRDGHDHSTVNGKKQKRVEFGTSWLQLAGSESPPPISGKRGQAGPGASAIDHMIAGEFTESESPSRVVSPLDPQAI